MEERVYAREAEESRSSINHTSVCQVVFGGLLNCSVGCYWICCCLGFLVDHRHRVKTLYAA